MEVRPGWQAINKQLEVKAGKFAELCAALKANQSVNWQFRADTTIDFNIHFHIGERIEYPERRAAVTQADGRLVARTAQTYCWMWDQPFKPRRRYRGSNSLSSKAFSGGSTDAGWSPSQRLYIANIFHLRPDDERM